MAVARLTFAGAPTRLDRYLRDRLGNGIGRRRITALLDGGGVRVNGRRAAKSALLRPGDEIVVDEDALAATPLTPTPAALAIVHRDTELVAVDKPPGMPSTAGRQGGASVAGALLHEHPEMAAIDPVRAGGLVHRLDTATSGLLVAARTRAAFERVRAAFAAKAVAKEYLAVVSGTVATAGRVTLPLARRGTRMMVTESGRGWWAETEYRPLVAADELTVVHLRMRSGVTHQLRVHLASIGHPVLADTRYGPAGASHEPWHYLHALRLRSDDPMVLPALETAFPRHWAPLFAARGWRIEAPPAW